MKPFLRIAILSAAHFAIAMLVSFAAFGPDLDQLRSRSNLSRAAAVAHDVLWFPHDMLLRAIPNAWLAGGSLLIPGAIALNSLVWGIALYAIGRLLRRAPQQARSRE